MLKTKIIFSLSVFLMGSAAIAQQPVYVGQPVMQSPPVMVAQPYVEMGRVGEVSARDGQIIVQYPQIPRTIRPGDRLTIITNRGTTCLVTVTGLDGIVAHTEIDSCPDIDAIVIGQEVRKSRITRRYREFGSRFDTQGIMASLSYSFANTTYISGSTPAGRSYTETDSLNGALGLNLDYYYLQEMGVGFTAGFTYEFSRNDNGGSGTIDNNSFIITYNPQPQFAFFIPNVNMTYMFNQYIYVLGGLNYAVISTQNTQNASYSSQIGYQLGIGSMFDDHWGAELQHRWINIGGTSNVGSISSGTLNGVVLKVGYHF